MRFLACFLGLLMAGFEPLAQPFVQGYFAAPLDIPLVLAGNFAEIRPRHFHAGLDFKTQGREGLPVYAAADGYLSRVASSPTGYGKVVYIDHPNGYTTVYAHLSRFAHPADSLIRTEHYARRSLQVNAYPLRGKYPVRKGQIIGWSGNSGSSGGPHLHFEIRDTYTENPHNPLLFGLKVADTRPPSLVRLWAYPIDSSSSIDGQQQAKAWPIRRRAGQWQVEGTVRVRGRVGFGLETFDQLDAADNPCGIYSLAMHIDQRPVYTMRMTEHAFDESKQINAHIDFRAFQTHRYKIHRAFVLPNNRLRIYDRDLGDGSYTFTKNHRVQLVVYDAAGNKSQLYFDTEPAPDPPLAKVPEGQHWAWDETHYVIEPDVRAIFARGSFYRDIRFRYARANAKGACLSQLYALHDDSEPIDKPMQLAIEAPITWRQNPKLMLARVDDNGRPLASYTGQWMDGFLAGSVPALGTYCLVADTVPPYIRPLAAAQRPGQLPGSTLVFELGDARSGIQTIHAYIDQRWTLCTWDPKRHRLELMLPNQASAHAGWQVRIELTDAVGNSAYFDNWYRKME